MAAHESLLLPWVFSDQPDLTADIGFSPGVSGLIHLDLVLGGRFAGFGLPAGAGRAPRLDITCEFADPSHLEQDKRVLRTVADLGEVLKEYGLAFSPARFQAGSSLIYKAELTTDLAPGDYNLSLSLKDAGLSLESRRTLHVIVPELNLADWQLGDLKFITAVGKRLDGQGKAQRVLDPNPWRQVGGDLGWDLLVAYSDLGPRPQGPVQRAYRVRRLRSQELVWQDAGPAEAKRADQVWLLRLPEAQVRRWKGGIYELEVELRSGARHCSAIKTFEVLP